MISMKMNLKMRKMTLTILEKKIVSMMINQEIMKIQMMMKKMEEIIYRISLIKSKGEKRLVGFEKLMISWRNLKNKVLKLIYLITFSLLL